MVVGPIPTPPSTTDGTVPSVSTVGDMSMDQFMTLLGQVVQANMTNPNTVTLTSVAVLSQSIITPLLGTVAENTSAVTTVVSSTVAPITSHPAVIIRCVSVTVHVRVYVVRVHVHGWVMVALDAFTLQVIYVCG